jgi:hypothetical protein
MQRLAVTGVNPRSARAALAFADNVANRALLISSIDIP